MIAWAYLDVDDPLVAWMAYRGGLSSASEVHPQALSFWFSRLLSRAKHSANEYATEMAVESARQYGHPKTASRVRGFFAFPDKQSATRAARWRGSFNSEFLTEIELDGEAVLGQHDSSWWHETPGAWIERYLSGDPQGPQPIWELVIEGRATIRGDALRRRARTVVAKTWPTSLGALELAHAAFLLGSDLGIIAPMILGGVDQPSITYVMSFENAEDPQFLAGLKQLIATGALDTSALGSVFNGGTRPDLRSRETRLH